MEKRLDLIIDPSKAKTGAEQAERYAKNVEVAGNKAADAFKNLTASLSGVGSNFSKFLKSVDSSKIDRLNTNLKATVTSAKSVSSTLDSLTKRTGSMSDKVSGLSSKLTTLNKRFSSLDDNTRGFRDNLSASNRLFGTFQTRLNRVSDSSKAVASEMYSARDGAKSLSTNLTSLSSRTTKTGNSMSFFRDRLVAVNKEFTPLKNNASSVAEQFSRTDEKIKKLGNSFTGLSDSMKQAAKGLNTATKQLEAMDRKLKSAEKQLERTENKTNSLSRSLKNLSSVLSGVSFALATREAIAFVDSYTNLQNKIAVVSKGTIDLDVATRNLLDTSIAARSDLESTVDVYSKLIRVNGEYGKSQSEIMQITETVSKAVAMSGASVQGAQGALMQFSQGLASNFRAAGQELNSVIEQTPALAQALASALTATGKLGDVAVSDLKDIAEQGKITTELVLEGFLLIKESVDKDFNEATRTMGQSFQALNDSLRVFVGEADKAVGVSKTISEVVTTLAANLNNFKDVIAALGVFVGILGAAALTSAIVALAGFLGLFTAGGAIVGGIALIGAGIAGLIAETDKFDDSLKESERTLQGITQLTNEPFNLFSNLDAMDEAYSKLEDAKNQVAELKRQLKDPSTIYIRDEITEKLAIAKEAVDKYRKALDLLHNSQDQGIFFQGNSARMTELELIQKTTMAFYDQLAALKQTDQQKYQSIYLIEQYSIAAKESIPITSELVKLWISQANALFNAEKGNKSSNRTVKETVKTYKQLKAIFDPLVKIENEYQELVKDINKSTSTRIQKEELLADALEKRNSEIKELKDSEVTLKKITDGVVTSLRLETSALGLNSKEMIQREALTRAINEAKAEGLSLDQDSIRAIIAEANAYSEASDALEDYKKEVEKRKQLSEDIANTFMDGFKAAMEGMENFKKWFRNYLRELALTALKNKIIIPITQQFFGGQGGSAGQAAGFPTNPVDLLTGGLSNIGSFFGGGGGNFLQNQFMDFAYSEFGANLGLSQASAASVNADKIIPQLGEFGEVVHEALGMIGAGLTAFSVAQESGPVAGTLAGVGSLALGTTVTVALESGIAAGLAAGGAMLTNPIGWAIAGIGALLGSLDKPSDKLQTSSIDLASGRTFQGGFEGDKFSQENRDFADALAGTVSVMSSIIGDKTGITPEGGIDILIGNRDGFRLQYQGELVLSSKDSEEFVKQVEDFTASLYEFDLDIYRELAKESESTVMALIRMEEQLAVVKDSVNLIGGTFQVAGDDAIRYSDTIVNAAGGLENFTQGVLRFGQEIVSNTAGLQFLDQVRNLSSLFNEIGVSVMPTTNEQFHDLLNSLDLTTEYGQTLYGALINLAPAFFDFTKNLESLFDVITPLTDLAQSIREQMMGEQELYEFRKQQAEDLAATLNTLTDPSEIASTVDEIERLTSQAWSGLTENQQQAMGQEFIDFLDQTAAIATNQLENLTSGAITEGLEQAGVSQERAADLSAQAAENMALAADELSSASQALLAAARELSSLGSNMQSRENEIDYK